MCSLSASETRSAAGDLGREAREVVALALDPVALLGTLVDGVAVGEHDRGDLGAEPLLDLGQRRRPATVLDDVVQQTADRLVLVALHLEHERRDREQVRGVGDGGALAQLARVVARRVVQRRVEALGQQRRVGEGLAHARPA